MGEVHQEGPTPPKVQAEKSPARASTEGSTHTEITATEVVDTNRTPTTDVAGEPVALPRQTSPGNPLALVSLFFLGNCFASRYLTQRFLVSHHCCLLVSSAAPLVEEPELLEEVASIGKDATEEAAKIAAVEGHEQAAGDIQESLKKVEKTLGSTSGLGIAIEEKDPLQSMGPLPSSHPLAMAPQPSPGKLALVVARSGPDTPGSSVSADANFDEEIRHILTLLS